MLLRRHLQPGRIVIPKSVNPDRIKENIDVFDFDVSAAAVDAISSLERDLRVGPHPATVNG
ncbi:hypothetical protein ACQPWW_13545 [Micromonospora sp. CA-240977]|uniref:hypothetical protein n=1 Tax=Micromonospora sp. CA-240977 TaxID=3239957 RepID=UPI003D93541B